MKRLILFAALILAGATAWLLGQSPAGDPLIEGLRNVEVASVADAYEQLYGQKIYMAHDMRPLGTTKFAGPAVTVLLKKGEHKEGAAAEGLFMAPEGGACIAALRRLRASGHLSADDTVVVFNTGTGFKYVE